VKKFGAPIFSLVGNVQLCCLWKKMQLSAPPNFFFTRTTPLHMVCIYNDALCNIVLSQENRSERSVCEASLVFTGSQPGGCGLVVRNLVHR